MADTNSPPLRNSGIAKASLTEKPPAQLNVKPVQLVQPKVGTLAAAPSSGSALAGAGGTSQPPAAGQPLAMPKIEPVQLNANGNLSRYGSAASNDAPLAENRTFSAPENDASLQQLKELRKLCVLPEIPVNGALSSFKAACCESTPAENAAAPADKDKGNSGGESEVRVVETRELDFEAFSACYRKVCEEHGKAAPAATVMQEVFNLFDKDGNGKMDMMELCSGLSMMCQGSEDDKIQAVFACFDADGNGLISQDEMFVFLSSVFKVVLTPAVMASLADCGVQITGPEDLANVTTTECFAQADVDKDGQLSVEEFKSWFYAPRNDPAFMFAPMRTLLE